MAAYHKKSRIGEGGCGVVFRAVLDGTSEEFAWKETKPGATDDEIRRFKREVRLMHQLSHPHVMPVLAYDLERNPPLFIMPIAEYPLRDVIDEYVANREEAIDLFLAVCSAVSHAHQQGILHRDLKPENILMVKGVPKVADFGLGRELSRQTTTLTHTNVPMGTIAYMPPEQMRDARSADQRCDVYALGKILYELFVGEVPFPEMHTSRLQDGFRYVVEKATKNRVEDRYFSVDELSNEIQLLTQKKQLLQPILADAQNQIASAAATGDPEQVRRIMRLLKSRPNDSSLYLEIVAKLPQRVIEVASTCCNDDLCDVMDVFCQHTAGQMTFSFVDIIANLLRSAFLACHRLDTKRRIVERLLRIGYDHHRFYVRTVVQQLAECLAEHDDIMVFRDAADACGECLSWYSAAFTARTPEVIRHTVTRHCGADT